MTNFNLVRRNRLKFFTYQGKLGELELKEHSFDRKFDVQSQNVFLQPRIMKIQTFTKFHPYSKAPE